MRTEELARKCATRYHHGQFRKGNHEPYIVHPAAVVRYLKQHGIDDDVSLSVAWLHDVVEDTAMTWEQVENIFGKDIASGVHLLTRDVGREEYKTRLSYAPDNIKMVKLCDTLHNVEDMKYMSLKGIWRKINDCRDYYIPMARELCPGIASRLEICIEDYLFSRNQLSGIPVPAV
ncbi:HD domain-containing protein [Candidatus Woesearchaeota archaeon]|nr:HD domain-containing protein [Candidatus Woesearchaeota archaeon]